MASIARITGDFSAPHPWRAIAAAAAGWLNDKGLAPHDAIVLVPSAPHVAAARQAFAAMPGLLPRIETSATLNRSLGPPPPAPRGAFMHTRALDRLSARQRLLRHEFARAWARRDARDFTWGVEAFVDAACTFAQALGAIAPALRAARIEQVYAALATSSTPSAIDRALLQLAFEWVVESGAAPTDRLFTLRPSAWIVVDAGDDDPLAQALATHDSRTPALQIHAGVTLDQALRDAASREDIHLVVCADFEDEARETAARVVDEINQSHTPVALVSQDRELTRRVRALLARQHVPMRDETGWRLSTTRAGAVIALTLAAARPDSAADTVLDWLKSTAEHWPSFDQAEHALNALEAAWRRARTRTVPDELSDLAARLWRESQAALVPLRSAIESRAFNAWGDWLVGLEQALAACGAWRVLADDDAGRQVLAALHLGDADAGAAVDASMRFDEFVAWVDAVLDASSFLPPAPDDALVVITPLERVALRSFGAVVFAGCDAKRLPAQPPPRPLLDDALVSAMGVPTRDAQRERAAARFAQVLRLPRLHLLRRREEDGQALAPATAWAQLEALRDAQGRSTSVATQARATVRTLQAAPIARPLPVAPDRLPQSLSASACEALRACPYRFYARYLLGLPPLDELDTDIEKRDYGTWLHAVLHEFHQARPAARERAVDEQALTTIAARHRAQWGFDDDPSFLPYAAGFERFVPHYLDWLQQRDEQGAQWMAGETEVRSEPDAWLGVAMRGTLDRLDRLPSGESRVVQLIDYKTGGADKLKARVKQAQEDTQLAFYAALLAFTSDDEAPIEAMYLALDERDGLVEIKHPDIATTALQLVDGLAVDLAKIRAGAPLPALGDEPECSFCDARGLCRRDHWADGPEQA